MHELYDNPSEPRECALDPDSLAPFAAQAFEAADSSSYDHRAGFFGGEDKPKCTGHTLAYHLVASACASMSKRPSQLIDTPAGVFRESLTTNTTAASSTDLVEEESGIAGSETSMTLLGIVEDHVHCHPEFVFAWPVEQTRAEFLQARWSEELQDLDFVAIPDVRAFLDAQSRNCTCTLVGGLELVLSRSRDQREFRSGAGHGSP